MQQNLLNTAALAKSLKKGLAMLALPLLLAASANAQQPFTPGNIIVERVGDGSTNDVALTQRIFLLEYTPDGDLVQTIALPDTGSNRLVQTRNGISDGGLKLSSDSARLIVTGIDTTVGIAIANSAQTYVIDTVSSGTIAGKAAAVTVSAAFSGMSFFSAVSNASNDYWGAASSASGGLRYFGNTQSAAIMLPETVFDIDIAGGQLYAAALRISGTSSHLLQVGTGQPKTATTPTPMFVVTGSLISFQLNAQGTVAYITRLNSNVITLEKYVKTAGTWTLNLTISTSARRMAVDWSAADPATGVGAIIYFTSSPIGPITHLYKVTDDGTNNPSATQLATGPIRTTLKGVSFAPKLPPCTPTVSVMAPTQPICYLSTAEFTANGTDLGSAPNYTWYHNNIEIQGQTGATLTVSDISKYNTETISVTVSSIDAACAIQTSVSDTITEQAVSTPNPAVLASGTKNLCEGGSVDLVHNGNPNNNPLAYSWIKDGIGEISTGAILSAHEAGTYTLTVTDPATGCARNSAPQVVTVKPNPVVDVMSSGQSFIVCAGNSMLLENSTTEPGVTYRWKRNGGTNVSTASSYNAKTTGSYTLTAILNGCSVTSPSVDVYVPLTPNVSVTSDGATALCAGGSVLLVAADIAGYTYQWYNGATLITNETTGEYLATAAGSYKVAISNEGCAPKNSAVTKVTMTTLPVATVMQTGQTSTSVTLRGNNGTVYGYQWYLNGSPIPGANGQYHTATVNGSYTLEISRNGCTNMSAPKVVDGLTGTGKLAVAEEAHQPIAVYPNPSEGIFNIASEEAVNVVVRDVQGRIIANINNAAQVDLTNQAAGIYLMQIMDAKGNLLQSERLIKK